MVFISFKCFVIIFTFFGCFLAEIHYDRAAMMEQLKSLAIQSNPMNDFVVKESLGKGHNAEVFKAQSKIDSNKIFAIKKMSLDRDKKIGYAINEITISTLINGSNILSIEEAYLFENHVYLVMKFISGMTLSHIPKKFKTEKDFLRIGFLLLNFLKVLKDNNICHRDISTSNAMMDVKTGEIYFIDFGRSVFIRTGNPSEGEKFEEFKYISSSSKCTDLDKAYIMVNRIINEGGIMLTNSLIEMKGIFEKLKNLLLSVEEAIQNEIFNDFYENKRFLKDDRSKETNSKNDSKTKIKGKNKTTEVISKTK